ncbi:MAG: hypothetical protein SGILL_004208 [Bacillariaceae sp.]
MHWHIYPLPEGSAPKHSMFPEGVVQAKVQNGILSYEVQDVLEALGYEKGQQLEAGVNLFVPLSLVSSISIQGVEQFVQVHVEDEALSSVRMSDALNITSTAIDSEIFVTSPYWKVDFTEEGVDNRVWMDLAAGSSLDASGIDTETFVRCPDGMTIKTKGVDNKILLEGQLLSALMEGVETEIEVSHSGSSSPCGNVTYSGVGNDCDGSDFVFEMENLSCLADTKAGFQCGWNLSIGAEVGIGIGIFLLLSVAIAGCIFGCVMCCRHKTDASTTETKCSSGAKRHGPRMGESSAHSSIKEAEVIAIDTDCDSSDDKFEDVEKAKLHG